MTISSWSDWISLFIPSKDTELEQLHRETTTRRNEIGELAKAQLELIKLQEKNRTLESLVRDVVDSSPDMLWSKDLGPKGDGVNGRFTFTNKAIREGLLISHDLKDSLGKPDIFFAKRQRKLGNDFTFGEVCSNSDIITLERNKDKNIDTAVSCSFLESGKVNGRFKKLMVIKKPRYNSTGKLIGTVGSGRDVTHEMEQLESVRLLWKAGRDSAICHQQGTVCSQATDALMEFMDQFVFSDDADFVIKSEP